MSELMTQEEIDAMLNGTAPVKNTQEETPASEDKAQSKSTGQASHVVPDLSMPLHPVPPAELKECLNEMEADAMGEIGNICMGAAATALYTILGRKVSITTPQVECTTPEIISADYDIPFVIVDVEYTDGVVGNNLLILRVEDVKIITDIMMGGDGTNTEGDLSELHLSAISEAMNQMMGGMSTSMADMLNRIVNISPPKTLIVELSSDEIKSLINSQSDSLVKIGFKMEIEGIIDSGIMQLMPMSFARELVGTVLGNFYNSTDEPEASEPAPSQPSETDTGSGAAVQSEPARQEPARSETTDNGYPQQSQPPAQDQPQTADYSRNAAGQPQQTPSYPGWPAAEGQPPYPGYPGQQTYPGYPAYPGYPYQYPAQADKDGQMPYPPYPPYGYPYGMPPTGMTGNDPQARQRTGRPPQKDDQRQVDVRPVQLDNFDFNDSMQNMPPEDGIGMIMDVPLQITVELGQARKSIKEILDISVGSIINLDKIAGEPVDIVINGKMIAKGEVIVIDDSYGVRITEIVSPSNRLRNIK